MGLLVVGVPLCWEDSKKYAEHVKEHGITQFLNIWDKLKDRQGDQLLWGDEVRLPAFCATLSDLFTRLSI